SSKFLLKVSSSFSLAPYTLGLECTDTHILSGQISIDQGQFACQRTVKGRDGAAPFAPGATLPGETEHPTDNTHHDCQERRTLPSKPHLFPQIPAAEEVRSRTGGPGKFHELCPESRAPEIPQILAFLNVMSR